MKRITRRHIPIYQTSAGFRVLMVIVAVIAIAGFVYYGGIANYKAQHLAEQYVHPWDFIGNGCLAVALFAVAAILLTRNDPLPPIRKRVASRRSWREARGENDTVSSKAKPRNKHAQIAPAERTMPRSGYNESNDN